METNNIIYWESYPIRKKLDGWDEGYSSVDEFKHHLTPDSLSISKEDHGWVFWTPETEYSSGNVFTEKITYVLRKLASKWRPHFTYTLVQFWAPEEVGGRCRLTTLHQPFAVGQSLAKGLSWLRKKCMQHFYVADDQHQLGPPGRVFRNGYPESSPDILLYTTQEFPLRDFVTGCGVKSYLVLPIFDVQLNRCVGVLEFMNPGGLLRAIRSYIFSASGIDRALKEVELRLTQKITDTAFYKDYDCIREMLDLSIENVPQLHLALAWVPCRKSCGNINCMELATSKMRNDDDDDYSLSEFHEAACALHNIQSGQGIVGLALSSTNKWCFCENASDFSISEYPMTHYAQRAGFSSCFAICARSKNNGNYSYVFEFFLQPQSRDGASSKSILYLLLKIMEKKLTSFEICAELYLGVVEYQQLKEHIMANVEEYKGRFSKSEFKEFFQTVELSSLQELRAKDDTSMSPLNQGREEIDFFWEIFLEKKLDDGWVCWSMKGKELFENRGDATSIPQLNQGIEEVKHLLSEILSLWTFEHKVLIQYWVPKMIGKRSFLSTSEQPFALRHLQKGLCWYRKQCIQYLYYIGDGAKEDELGPPGRVFLNGHPEASPDLRLYSEREFPLRDHAVKTSARKYLALPLFNLLHKKCVGVLEFVGFPFYWEEINEKLEKYNLRSTPISCPLSMLPIHEGQNQALFEIKEMLTLVTDSPQVRIAAAWISCTPCALNNIEISCMKRAWFSPHGNRRISQFISDYHFLQVHTRKGTIRKVIESESKLYFCENLCSSSICELPLAHYAQEARLEICFAVCLKSSYTGNSLYVIEFFLSPHSTKYEYSRTLCFLLSTMKQMLKSFKLASGQQLISDGIDSRTYVEYVSRNITGFSTANQLTGENIGGQSYLSQLGTENVQQHRHENEGQYSKNHTHLSGLDCASSSNMDQEQERNVADVINVEDEAQNITDVNFEEENERDMSSTSFHVSYEQLRSQFGKSRKDAVKNLRVSVSTFKRRCRDYGIKRWPSNMNYIKNPSLFLTDVANKCVKNVDHHQTSKSSGRDSTTSDFPVIQKTKEFASTSQAADVIIKAKFKDETLKFEFCVSWGVEKLMEEVGKRLNLKTGEFKIKYVDEDDGDLISLTCDEDLRFYVNSMKSIGKTTVQAVGVCSDPTLFFCERCESILQPGHNCTVRIEKNKLSKRRGHKKSDIATQNNVVYNCHFCSHRNLMRGTPKCYLQEISPPKAKQPSRFDAANHVVGRSTSLTQSTPTTVEANNKMETVAFPITDRQSLEPSSPSTPLPTTGRSLLDSKRRKRNRPSSQKAAEPEGNSTAADAEKSRCTSSKRRRKSWTSLKEIAQNAEHDSIKRFTNLTIPLFM